MATLTEIEKLTETYATARAVLSFGVGVLTGEIERAKRQHLKNIRARVAQAKDAQAALHAAIEASPDLFTKPRTRTLHGIKVGFQKGKGKVAWDDEDAVIKRIRKFLPEDQVELLIRRVESVHKEGVYDLSADDLKRLGISITDAGDAVIIKDTAGEVDKLVAALLKEDAEAVAA